MAVLVGEARPRSLSNEKRDLTRSRIRREDVPTGVDFGDGLELVGYAATSFSLP